MANQTELETLLKKGLQYQQDGNPVEALQCYDQVLQAIPHQIDAAYFKSIILLNSNHLDDVIELLSPIADPEKESPFELHPAIARCHRVMGSAFQSKQQWEVALGHFKKAWALDPKDLDYAADIIQLYLATNKIEEATFFATTCPSKARQHVRCLSAFAEINWRSWKVVECLADLQAAMKLAPAQLDLVSQYLFTSNYLESDGGMVAHQHIALGGALERHYRSHNQDESIAEPVATGAKKRLRIGFLSPDLREHSVAYFLLPLLRQLHEREDIWVAGYALNATLDSTSEQIASCCDHFVHTPAPQNLNWVELDQLDILFDLAGHSSGNALPLLISTPKPAALVVNWMGYANTTGFRYHDYRFVDEVTDPKPGANAHPEPCSERRILLKPSFLCYEAPVELPEINPLPSEKTGIITLGCLNNINKITLNTIQLWIEILQQNPNTQLLVKSPAFLSQSVKQRFLLPFEAQKIDLNRVQLLTRSPDLYSHLSTYHSIDFTLDTFPYNGTTTTFESLMMGCPVLTLEGKSHRARVSASILTHLGYPGWIAKDRTDYIQKSHILVSARSNLSEIRSQLREKLLNSALCDASTFSKNFVEACWNCKNSVNFE